MNKLKVIIVTEKEGKDGLRAEEKIDPDILNIFVPIILLLSYPLLS